MNAVISFLTVRFETCTGTTQGEGFWRHEASHLRLEIGFEEAAQTHALFWACRGRCPSRCCASTRHTKLSSAVVRLYVACTVAGNVYLSVLVALVRFHVGVSR